MANFNKVPQLNLTDPWPPILENALSYSQWLIDESWEQEGGKAQAGEHPIGRVKSVPKFTNWINAGINNEPSLGQSHYQSLQ